MNRRILILLALFLCSIGLSAQEVYTPASVPNPKNNGGGWVSDPGNLLTAQERQRINEIITRMENSSTAQMAVAIVPSIGDNIPKDFAVELFEEWGIGQKGVDNGLLLLMVMDQRRTEFETGYGLESVLPDIVLYRILMDNIIPEFQQGRFGSGIIAGVERVSTLLQNPEALALVKAELDPKRNWVYFFGWRIPPFLYWYGLITIFFCFGLLIWVLLTIYNKEDLYDKYRHIGYARNILFIILFPIPYIVVYFLLGGLRKRLRNQPRYSTHSGQLMHKLSEEEEDDFLEAGQITEEEIRSADYDVWVTEDHSDIMVLRYARRFTKYNNCPKCGFKTYYKEHTRVLRSATYSRSGQMEVLHECKNCHYQNRELHSIARKTRSSGGGFGGGSFGGGGGGGGSFGGGGSGGGGAGASW